MTALTDQKCPHCGTCLEDVIDKAAVQLLYENMDVLIPMAVAWVGCPKCKKETEVTFFYIQVMFELEGE